jgi:hypothetical protein
VTRSKLDTDWTETVNAAERNGDVELAFKAREIAAGLSDDSWTGADPRVLVRIVAGGPTYPGEFQHYEQFKRMRLVTLAWSSKRRMDVPSPSPLGRAVAAILEESKP